MKTTDSPVHILSSNMAFALLVLFSLVIWTPSNLGAQAKSGEFDRIADKSAKEAEAIKKNKGEGKDDLTDGENEDEAELEEQRMKDRDGDGAADEMTDEEWDALANPSGSLLGDDDAVNAALAAAADDERKRDSILNAAADKEFYRRNPGVKGKIDPDDTEKVAEWNQIKKEIAEKSRLNSLTDQEFYRQNPAMVDQKIRSDDTENKAKWNKINNDIQEKELAEKSRLNSLTDQEFYRQNPAMADQKIRSGDTENKAKWNKINNEIKERESRLSNIPNGAGLADLRLKEQKDADMAKSESFSGIDSGVTGSPIGNTNSAPGQERPSGSVPDSMPQNSSGLGDLRLKEQRDSEIANPGSSAGNLSGASGNSTELANNATNRNGGNNGNFGLKDKKEAQILDSGPLPNKNGPSQSPQGTSNNQSKMGNGQPVIPSAPEGDSLAQGTTNPPDAASIPMGRPQPGQLPGVGINGPLSMDIPGLPGTDSLEPENYVLKTDRQRKEEIQQAVAALDKKQMTDGQGIQNLADHRDKYSATADEIQGVRGDLQGYREEGKSDLNGAYMYGALQSASGAGDIATEFIPNQAVKNSIKFSKKVAEGDPLSATSVFAGATGYEGVKMVADSGKLILNATEMASKPLNGQDVEISDVSNVAENALTLAGKGKASGILNGSEKILQGGNTIVEALEESERQDSMFKHVDAQAKASHDKMIQKRDTLQNDLNQLSMSDEEIRKVIRNAESDPKYAAYLESDELKETRAKDRSEFEQRLSLANSRNKPASVQGNEGDGTPDAPATSQGNSSGTDANPAAMLGNTATPQNPLGSPAVPGNQSGGAPAVPMTRQGDALGKTENPATLAGNTTTSQSPQGASDTQSKMGNGQSAIPSASGRGVAPNGAERAVNGSAPAVDEKTLARRETNRPSDPASIPMERPRSGQQSGVAAKDPRSTEIPGLPDADAEPTPPNYAKKGKGTLTETLDMEKDVQYFSLDGNVLSSTQYKVEPKNIPLKPGVTFTKTDEKQGVLYSVDTPIIDLAYGTEQGADGSESTVYGVGKGQIKARLKHSDSDKSKSMEGELRGDIEVKKIGSIKNRVNGRIEANKVNEENDPFGTLDPIFYKDVRVGMEASTELALEPEIKIKSESGNNIKNKTTWFSEKIEWVKSKFVIKNGIRSSPRSVQAYEDQLLADYFGLNGHYVKGSEAARKARLNSQKYQREYDSYGDKDSERARKALELATQWGEAAKMAEQ